MRPVYVGGSFVHNGSEVMVAPAGRQVNDLLVAVSPYTGGVTGWTVHQALGYHQDTHVVVWTRRADGTATDNFPSAQDFNGTRRGNLTCWRGVASIGACSLSVQHGYNWPSGIDTGYGPQPDLSLSALAGIAGTDALYVFQNQHARHDGSVQLIGGTGLEEVHDGPYGFVMGRYFGRAAVNTSQPQESGVVRLSSASAQQQGYLGTNHFGAAFVLYGANTGPSNPGAPSVTPNPVNTTGTISWAASSDPDGDQVLYTVELSTNGGSSWTRIRQDQPGASFVYDFTNVAASSTARLRVYATDGLAGTGWVESANFTVQHNVAPTAGTVVQPANGTMVDLAAGYTFQVVPQDPDTGDSTNGYAMRRKVGAGAYEYWNASTAAWQSTEVVNTVTSVPKGSTLSVPFAAGKWTTGTTYNWAIRTRDAQNVLGPYGTDTTVTANRPPVFDVLTPTGTVTTSTRPQITWAYSDPDGDPQAVVQLKVFTAAQYGAGGFDPATSAALWSGTVNGAVPRDAQPTMDLPAGTQLRVYGRAQQATGQLWSAWDWSLFTVNVTPPATPSLTVVDQPGLGRVQLQVQSMDPGSVYTPANSTFTIEASDDGGTTWVPVRGCEALPLNAQRYAEGYDREATPGLPRRYRAAQVGDV